MKDFNETGIFESTAQHQEDILIARKGWLKFSPTLGVGIADFINAPANNKDIEIEVKKNFIADGMEIKNITFKNENLTVDAHYKS